MPDKDQTVDGFSDSASKEHTPTHGEQSGTPSAPDLGKTKGAKEPLSPQDYAKMKKEAEEDNSAKDEER